MPESTKLAKLAKLQMMATMDGFLTMAFAELLSCICWSGSYLVRCLNPRVRLFFEAEKQKLTNNLTFNPPLPPQRLVR